MSRDDRLSCQRGQRTLQTLSVDAHTIVLSSNLLIVVRGSTPGVVTLSTNLLLDSASDVVPSTNLLFERSLFTTAIRRQLRPINNTFLQDSGVKTCSRSF